MVRASHSESATLSRNSATVVNFGNARSNCCCAMVAVFNNDYCPNANVTRAQMAIFMVRAIEGGDNFNFSATPYFSDVQTNDFGFKWIQKMKELGITAGCTVTAYCPNDNVTRAQMAIFIVRARLGVNLAGSPPSFSYSTTPSFTDVAAGDFGFAWIQRMKRDGVTAGCTTTTYCPNDPVTRGQMAIFIMRAAFNLLLPANTPVLTQISPSVLPSGERYTVKTYESEKAKQGDSWCHNRITLKPMNSAFAPIILDEAVEGRVRIVAEVVEVLGQHQA